jgi:hypothetical protein
VVALLRRGRLVDRVVVVDEVGISLVRLAAEEAVEALEAPAQRPAPLPRGHVDLVPGVRCHVPTAYVFHPRSLRTSEMRPFSNGMRAEHPGKPAAPSVMHAMLFDVALRPLSRLERAGEHSAVVWKFE